MRAAISRGELAAVKRGRGYVIGADAVAAWTRAPLARESARHDKNVLVVLLVRGRWPGRSEGTGRERALCCSQHVPRTRGAAHMSVHRKADRWVVRWRSEGHQRSRTFRTKRDAVEFDRARQRDTRRDEAAAPAGTVPLATASHTMTFVVVEDLYDSSDGERTRDRTDPRGLLSDDRARGRLSPADARRRRAEDPRVLCPVRDQGYSTEEEIAAGEAQLDLARGDDDWIARVMRLVDEHEVTQP